jgi:hypothetical protein
VSQELDAIARQSEDSERVVREMEALVQMSDADAESSPAVAPARSANSASGRTRDSREKNR